MTYTVKTKDGRIVRVAADNIADGRDFGTWSDKVCFYVEYDDGSHKRPQKREVARFNADFIEYVISDENCEVYEVVGND